MIVCDECRDTNARAFDCNLILEKEEDAVSKTKRSEGVPKRMKRREVVRIPVALCEKCITRVCKGLGTMKMKGLLGRCGREEHDDVAATHPRVE